MITGFNNKNLNELKSGIHGARFGEEDDVADVVFIPDRAAPPVSERERKRKGGRLGLDCARGEVSGPLLAWLSAWLG